MAAFRFCEAFVVTSASTESSTLQAAPADGDRITFQQLCAAFDKAEGQPNVLPAHHAGLLAVLELLSDAAQRRAAVQIERYDHRSLYAFAAELRYAARASCIVASTGTAAT